MQTSSNLNLKSTLLQLYSKFTSPYALNLFHTTLYQHFSRKLPFYEQNQENTHLYQHFLNSTFISTLGPHYLDHCAIYKLGYQKQVKTHIESPCGLSPLGGSFEEACHVYVRDQDYTKALQGGV